MPTGEVAARGEGGGERELVTAHELGLELLEHIDVYTRERAGRDCPSIRHLCRPLRGAKGRPITDLGGRAGGRNAGGGKAWVTTAKTGL